MIVHEWIMMERKSVNENGLNHWKIRFFLCILFYLSFIKHRQIYFSPIKYYIILKASVIRHSILLYVFFVCVRLKSVHLAFVMQATNFIIIVICGFLTVMRVWKSAEELAMCVCAIEKNAKFTWIMGI